MNAANISETNQFTYSAVAVVTGELGMGIKKKAVKDFKAKPNWLLLLS